MAALRRDNRQMKAKGREGGHLSDCAPARKQAPVVPGTAHNSGLGAKTLPVVSGMALLIASATSRLLVWRFWACPVDPGNMRWLL